MADDPPNPIPDAMLEAATAWLMRRREPDGDAADEVAYADWLAADARHPHAMAEAARLWDMLALPAAIQAERRDRPTLPRRTGAVRRPGIHPLRRVRTWAAAAGFVLAVAATAVWWPEIRDDLRADHRTAAGERRTVELAEGSRIALNTGTALAVDVGGGGRVVRLFRGEAFFDVARDPARPFRVELPAGSVEVLGTRFNVRIEGRSATVSVLEGRVAARPSDGVAGRPIGAGEQVVVTSAAATSPAAVDVEAAAAWRRGRLVFYRAPLAEVVAELGRYRDGHVVLLGRDLGGKRVTGAFDTARPDAALDIVAATLGITVTRLPFGLTLLR